jgi:hypothetical protein
MSHSCICAFFPPHPVYCTVSVVAMMTIIRMWNVIRLALYHICIPHSAMRSSLCFSHDTSSSQLQFVVSFSATPPTTPPTTFISSAVEKDVGTAVVQQQCFCIYSLLARSLSPQHSVLCTIHSYRFTLKPYYYYYYTAFLTEL